MQSTLTSPILWLILIPSVFVFLLIVYLATYHLMKKAVYEVTKDAIYDVVYDAIQESAGKGNVTTVSDIDFDDLSDKIDKTFKLSKVTYKNVKSILEQ